MRASPFLRFLGLAISMAPSWALSAPVDLGGPVRQAACDDGAGAWIPLSRDLPPLLGDELPPEELPVDDPILPGNCTGKIRPGAGLGPPFELENPVCADDRCQAQTVAVTKASCTINFLWAGTDGATYFGTAGHCAAAVGFGLSVRGVPVTAAQVVFTITEGVGRDFALARVLPGAQAYVEPSMCFWGGPTGLYDRQATIDPPGQVGGLGTDVEPFPIHHYGFGVGYGSQPWTRARTAWGALAGPWDITLVTTAANGDSGSPVILATGEALGHITHGVPGALGWSAGPLIRGMRTSAAVELAEEALGVQLTLLTAPLNRPV